MTGIDSRKGASRMNHNDDNPKDAACAIPQGERESRMQTCHLLHCMRGMHARHTCGVGRLLIVSSGAGACIAASSGGSSGFPRLRVCATAKIWSAATPAAGQGRSHRIVSCRIVPYRIVSHRIAWVYIYRILFCRIVLHRIASHRCW